MILLIRIMEAEAATTTTTSLQPSEQPSEQPATDAPLQEAQDLTVLLTTLLLYLPAFVMIIILFSYVRRRYPVVYNVRNTVGQLHNPLAETTYGYIDWTWKIMAIPEEALLEHCGMDAVCLLRILRLGYRLSCAGVLCSIALIPLYFAAPPDVYNVNATANTWASTTTANVPDESSRYTATVLAAYVIFGYTMYLVLSEFQWFTVTRETFLTAKVARSYTVYISGIPAQYRSNAALAGFFRRVISEDAVYAAAVVLHIPKLTAATNRRATLQRQLERAHALKDMGLVEEPMLTNLKPTISAEIIERIPAIDYYKQQLEKVEEVIRNLRTLIEARQQASNAALDVSSSQRRRQDHASSSVFAASLAVGTVTCCVDSEIQGEENAAAMKSQTKLSSEADTRELQEGSRHVDRRSDFSSGFRTSTCCTGIEDEEEEHSATILPDDAGSEHLSAEGPELATDSEHPSEAHERGMVDIVLKVASAVGLGGGDEGKPLDVGFVTFTKLSAVTVALQVIHSKVPFEMDVVEAPSPEEVLWSNVGLKQQSLQVGKLLAFSITTALCIFWTVPVTFLVSLTEVNALKANLTFLQDWLEDAPWLEGVLNQIAPLLLTFLNTVILPLFLRRTSTLEGVLGESHLEASLFTKLAAFNVSTNTLLDFQFPLFLWWRHHLHHYPALFHRALCLCLQIFQTFIVASLTGSITSALSSVDQASDIFQYLASTLPAQAVFFMQLIFIGTVIGLGCELLRTTALIQAVFRNRLGPRLTENDKSSPFLGLRPLCNPRNFLHAQVLASASLYFMILFTFATLTPLISYVLLLSFVALEIGCRHQCIYIYPPKPDSGGRLWMIFVTIALICMIVAELTLLSLMALTEARTQLAMMIPLVVVTILFVVYIRQKHFRVARNLSSETGVEVDARNNLHDCAERFDFLKDKYLQPALLGIEEDHTDSISYQERNLGRVETIGE